MEVRKGLNGTSIVILLIKFHFRIVFWMVFGILLGTGVIYLFFADGEVQHWNNPNKSKRRSIDNENSEQNPSKNFSSSL